MELNANTEAVVHYPGPRIVVTSRYIENSNGRYLIRDLRFIDQVLVAGHPATKVALVCGAIELGVAAPVAAALGSAIMFCAGFVVAAGVAAAALADGRRNPRWMALRAVHRGHEITLFASRDRREFEQVRRAVIRAVEASRAPWR